jgi:hypothetical protein
MAGAEWAHEVGPVGGPRVTSRTMERTGILLAILGAAAQVGLPWGLDRLSIIGGMLPARARGCSLLPDWRRAAVRGRQSVTQECLTRCIVL